MACHLELTLSQLNQPRIATTLSGPISGWVPKMPLPPTLKLQSDALQTHHLTGCQSVCESEPEREVIVLQFQASQSPSSSVVVSGKYGYLGKQAATVKASQKPAARPSSAGTNRCHQAYEGLDSGFARAERANHFNVTAEAAWCVGIMLTLDALAFVL